MATMQRYRVVKEDERLSIRDRLREMIRGYVLPPLSSSSPDVARYFSDGGPTATGVPVNEHTALNYAAVWRAVNLVAGDISSLPLQLFKRTKDGGKEVFPSHPLYRLLHDAPNPEMTSMVWRRTQQAHTLTWGNGYAEIVRDNAGRPMELWPLTPDRVMPFRASAGGPLQYRVANSGNADTILNATDVLHIPGLSFDGVSGYSVIHKARESIGLGLATEQFGARFFGNGATFGGVIAYKGPKPTDGSQQNLLDAINARHQGVDRSHKFLALYNDATYTRLGIPPDDAQFLQTRAFQVTEIARWYGVPAHKLGDLERSTHSNIEQQEIDYYVSALMNWLQVWEQELTLKLIAKSEVNIQVIEHNLEGRLRGDTASRGEFYSKQFSIGSITSNEIRSAENRAPLAGGDELFVPLNLIPLSKVNDYYDALITEKKAPKTPPSPQASPTDAAMNRENEFLKEQVALARACAQQAEDLRDVAVAERTAREQELTAVRAEVDALRPVAAIVPALTTERDALKEQAEALSLDVVEAQRSWEAAEQRLASLERDHQRVCLEGLTRLSEWETAVAEVTALREAAASQQSAIEGLSLDIVDRERQIADAGLRAETSAAVITELRTQIEALTIGVETARREVVDATALVARTETVLTATTEELATTAAALEAEAAARVFAESRIGATRTALRTVATDLIAFFLEREVGRARQKQGSPEKLRAWVQTFYPSQQDVLVSSLRSVTRAAAALDGAEGVADLPTFAQDYLARSQRELLFLASEHDDETLAPALERLLRRWETDRAEQAADALLRKGA